MPSQKFSIGNALHSQVLWLYPFLVYYLTLFYSSLFSGLLAWLAQYYQTAAIVKGFSFPYAPIIKLVLLLYEKRYPTIWCYFWGVGVPKIALLIFHPFLKLLKQCLQATCELCKTYLQALLINKNTFTNWIFSYTVQLKYNDDNNHT